MKVSLCLLTLNGSRWLQDLFEAVGRQTRQPAEIIVRDSGSTDASVEICRAAGARVIDRPNRSGEAFDHGSARNEVINYTSGELVVLMVQDAIPADENWLAELIHPLEQGTADASYARQLPRDTADPVTRRNLLRWCAAAPQPRIQRLTPTEFASLSPGDRMRSCSFDNVCSAVKRTVWERNKFASTVFAEDLEFGRDLLLGGGAIAYAANAAVYHSHEYKSIRERFRREIICHRRLAELFDLHTIPSPVSLPRAIIITACADVIHTLRVAGTAGIPHALKCIPGAAASCVGQYLGGAKGVYLPPAPRLTAYAPEAAPPPRTGEEDGLRVLQVVHGYPPESLGGAEIYARNLSEALCAHCPVTVFARSPSLKHGAVNTSDTVDGRPSVVRIGRGFTGAGFRAGYYDETVERTFRRLLEERKPEVVHFHHLTFLSSGLPGAAKRAGAAVVFTLHDYWLLCRRGQLYDRALKFCVGPGRVRCARCWPAPGPRMLANMALIPAFHMSFREMGDALAACDLLISPSQDLADRFRALADTLGIRLAKLMVRDYGMRDFAALPKTAVAGEKLRMKFFGSLMFTKGAHIPVEALIKSGCGNIRIDLHGGFSNYHEIGGYEEYLRALADKHDAVSYCGTYGPADLPALMAKTDAVLCPSLWPENSPLVVHEALQAGVPVLGSRIGGIPELVTEGEDGYLLPAGDIDAWVELFRQLERDPKRIRLLRPTRKHIIDIGEQAIWMLEQYNYLLKRKA